MYKNKYKNAANNQLYLGIRNEGSKRHQWAIICWFSGVLGLRLDSLVVIQDIMSGWRSLDACYI